MMHKVLSLSAILFLSGCMKTIYTIGPACEHKPIVIVYGTEWCTPCHQATRYLGEHGVCTISKDVERDSDAKDEMRYKLRSMPKPPSLITYPTIDVDGEILLGFEPGILNGALVRHRIDTK